jgi:hypothetical protein
MVMVQRGARAYCKAASGTAAPSADCSAATLAAAGWIDLGWIENLKRTAGTEIEALRAGTNGAVVKQVVANLDARVEFDFMEWGKLQMALTARGTPMNVLDGTVTAVTVQPGSTASALTLAAASSFAVGDLVAVDVDYSGQTGALGNGLGAAWVTSAAAVGSNANYVRQVTLNVARIASVSGTQLTLQQALPGGAPATGAKVQKVQAFVDREAGNYFPEWSVLLAITGEAGGTLSFYYPRLQAAAPASENGTEIMAPLETMALRASFRALPYQDVYDGTPVLCYRTYTPAAGAPAY